MDNQLYTTKEIENLFKVTKQTVMRWRKKGVLPCVKINSRVFLYKKDDIEQILNNNFEEFNDDHK